MDILIHVTHNVGSLLFVSLVTRQVILLLDIQLSKRVSIKLLVIKIIVIFYSFVSRYKIA